MGKSSVWRSLSCDMVGGTLLTSERLSTWLLRSAMRSSMLSVAIDESGREA